MVSESRQVAFTNRQWEAYQYVLEFHRLQHRTPNAQELSQGLRISEIEAATLIRALTVKGVLQRRVYHVLAVVPPDYYRHQQAAV